MRYPITLLALTIALACRCGLGPLSGGTTDTGNARVAACIVKEDGCYAAGAYVIVRPADHLKAFVLPKSAARFREYLTDAYGRFSIDSLPAGEYCIEVNDRAATAALFRFTVAPGDTAQIFLHDTLRPYAGVEGSIGMKPPQYTFVQVYGLERCVTVAATGRFVLSDLPPGEHKLRIASLDSSFVPVEVGTVSCTAGVVTNLTLAQWRYSRQLFLNTSTTGANVVATVTGFPVLVRLTAGTFDFSQARPDGADIRFTKPDMTLLPHEIERWDPVGGAAELWVRLDTVLGNTADQYLLMFWGNPGALDQSEGGRVFDTADAFRGVWHLGESSGTVDDVTFDRHNGSRIGNQSHTPGVIGFGQAYVDSGDYSDMGDVLDPGASNMTVSAWVKRSDTGGVYTIVGKTNGDTILQSNYGWLLALNNDVPRFYLASSGTRWGEVGTFFCGSSVKITDTDRWHFVCVVIDKMRSANCRIFLDGIDVTGVRVGDITRVAGISNTLPMRIGMEADGDYPIKGFADEVVVSFAAHSADWVRLCYMNQKPDNRLVEFGSNNP
ncbi:MAG: DUF2341 domain-containing protein [Chitinispirillaceae bacterium]|nr:DUF2341 domain-containing protein [Chitinispirillaceae bacterium]